MTVLPSLALDVPDHLYIIGGHSQVGNWNIANAPELTKVEGRDGVFEITLTTDIGIFNNFRFYAERDWNATAYGPEVLNGNGEPQEDEKFIGFSLWKDAQCEIVQTAGGKGKYQFYNAPRDRVMKLTVDIKNGNLRCDYEGEIYYPEVLYVLTEANNNFEANDQCPVLTKKEGTAAEYEGTFTPAAATRMRFRLSDHHGWAQGGETYWKPVPAKYGSYGAADPDFRVNTDQGPSSGWVAVKGGYNNWEIVPFKEGSVKVYVNIGDPMNMSAHIETDPTNQLSAPEQLFIVGDLNGWNTTATPLVKNDDGTFSLRNVNLINRNGNCCRFHFVTNKEWEERFCYISTELADIHFTGLDNYDYQMRLVEQVDVDNGRDNSFKVYNGVYDITVDFNTGHVIVKRAAAPTKLYIVGDGIGWDWNNKKIELNSNGDGTWSINNVVLFEDNKDYEGFYFLGENGWSQRYSYRYYGDPKDSSIETSFTFNYECVASGEKSFRVKPGVYNFTVDTKKQTVKIEPVANYVDPNVAINMSFWEGPISRAFEKAEKPKDNVSFQKVSESNGHYYYKIDVPTSDNDDTFGYVSQCWMGGHAVFDTYEYHKDTDSFTRARKSMTPKDGYWYQWRTFYFDAHQSDVFVPVKTEFWCDNSRMEVGMKVKAIYLDIDSNADYNFEQEGFDGREDSSTPFRILISSTGEFDPNSPAQRPFNADSYSLTLYGGSVYDALKGTQTGAIEVPFVRHTGADGGYVINLGRDVTTKEAERFSFRVNDKTYTAHHFDINAVNQEFIANGGENRFGEELTFNRIILMVSGDKYDEYALYLSNGGNAPEKFTVHEKKLPMLKVWTNNAAAWDDMYDNTSIKPDREDGSTKYYDFQPVKSLMNDNATNVYYLDLPGGVKIHKAGYKTDKKYGPEGNKVDDTNHHDQFNIITSDGYDVYNPYQGSQYIFPDTWWCANPNLIDDVNGTREYLGHRFREVPVTPSRVDLAFNTEGEEEVTIYGITLFKIMGTGYDVYAEDVRERPNFYVYVSTKPSVGSTIMEKCEQTAPILLEVKNGETLSSSDEFSQKFATADHPMSYSETSMKLYKPTSPEASAFNTPLAKEQASRAAGDQYKHFMLTLSPTRLKTNDDLNYTLESETFRFTPGNAEAFEFVDVTGTLRWNAYGHNDLLRPNKWSNYYSGTGDPELKLTVQRPNIEYYKFVLATNTDQARYQIMSYDMSINANSGLHYSSTKNPDHASENLLVYPTTDVDGLFIWRNGYDLKVTLTFTDGEGNVVATKDVTYDKIPEGSALPDVEGFYAEGESPFEVNLGKFFTAPGLNVSATAKYIPNGDDKSAYTLNSRSYTTPDLEKPFIQNLEAAPGEFDKAGGYTSSLKWENDNTDIPRHYDIDQYDMTGTDKPADQPAQGDGNASSNHNHESGKSTENNDGNADYAYGDASVTGATPVNDSEVVNSDNKPEVTIGYTVGANYHYAVPANGAGEFDPNVSFVTIPQGFNGTVVKSHDNWADRPSATAVFVGDTQTGVDGVIGDDNDAPVEYYNLQGIRVDNPAPGNVYIRRQGTSTTKVFVR